MHQGAHTFTVERRSIVGAIQMSVREMNLDPAAHPTHQLISSVLDQLNELSLRISTTSRVLLLIGVFINEILLSCIGLQSVLGLIADICGQLAMHASPFIWLHALTSDRSVLGCEQWRF